MTKRMAFILAMTGYFALHLLVLPVFVFGAPLWVITGKNIIVAFMEFMDGTALEFVKGLDV